MILLRPGSNQLNYLLNAENWNRKNIFFLSFCLNHALQNWKENLIIYSIPEEKFLLLDSLYSVYFCSFSLYILNNKFYSSE